MMDRIASGSTGLPSTFTRLTLLGWMYEPTSFTADFTKTTMRLTLMPPPVEPAQAPQNIRSTSTVFAAECQRSKSTVAKPVVVMMVDTWNAACVKASKGSKVPSRGTRHTTTAAATMTKYHRTSSI